MEDMNAVPWSLQVTQHKQQSHLKQRQHSSCLANIFFASWDLQPPFSKVFIYGRRQNVAIQQQASIKNRQMPCLQELDCAPLIPYCMMASGDVAQPPTLNSQWYMEPFFETFIWCQTCPILRVRGLQVVLHRLRVTAAGRRIGKLEIKV